MGVKNFCLIAVLGAVIAGCAVSGPKIDPGRLTELRTGQTTIAEIVRQFGRPGILSKNPDGTQWAIYVHKDGPAGVTVPLVAADPVESVTFYFDTNGLLTNYKTTQAYANKPPPADMAKSTQTVADKSVPDSSSKPAQPESAKNAPTETNKAPSGTANTFRLPGWLPSSTTENR